MYSTCHVDIHVFVTGAIFVIMTCNNDFHCIIPFLLQLGFCEMHKTLPVGLAVTEHESGPLASIKTTIIYCSYYMYLYFLLN
jgi:hypothetical protein